MTTLLKKSRPGVLAVLAVVLFIAGYAYFRSENLLKGPAITIESPVTGLTVENDQVAVTGEVKRISSLFMNGRQIFTDESGRFSESLLLAYGYNIIELKAQDKFGRGVTKTIELVLK